MSHSELTPPWPPVTEMCLVLDYPLVQNHPIDEFRTEDYIAMAFPLLFPYGTCDYRDNSLRRAAVTGIEYFRHLLRYKDGRFGRDPRFLQFMLNSRSRWQMLKSANLFIQKQDMEHLTTSDLRDILADPLQADSIAKRISRYGGQVPGLRPYWTKQKRELLAICKRRCPNAFVTYSAADTHWQKLHVLIEQQRHIATGISVDLSTLSMVEQRR